MATQTENYKLNKPDRTDKVNVEVLNENFDIIDKELKNGRLYIVTFSVSDEGGFTADKTFAEVRTAVDLGMEVMAFYSPNRNDTYYIPLAVDHGGILIFAKRIDMGFDGGLLDGTVSISHVFGFKSDDTVECIDANCQSLPEVSESDNGKVLKVVDGAWNMVDMPAGTGSQAAVLTTGLDFTNWDGGSFTEMFADGTAIAHTVTFDADGNVTSVGGITIVGVG